MSSFGIGGTNAHVVLEQAPETEVSEGARSWHLLALSAKTRSALEKATDNFAEYLRQHPDLNLADIAYTSQVGRRAFSHRRVLVCRGLEDAAAALETRDPERVLTGVWNGGERLVSFVFPGQGEQYLNMAFGLYQAEPVFREHMDHCAEILEPHLGVDLREILFSDKERVGEVGEGADATDSLHGFDLRGMLRLGEDGEGEAIGELDEPTLAHPALFVIEYALAQLLMEWEVRPQAMIGHSIGEYVAACLADVFSLEDALALVVRRAQMIQELPKGAMLAVPFSEEEAQSFVSEAVSLSAVNGPSLCVLGGSPEAIIELEQSLMEQGSVYRRVKSTRAFHSKMMEPIADRFVSLVEEIGPRPPAIPYVSNVTGTWITAEQATDPDYWGMHLCQPVRFAEGVKELWEGGNWMLLEVGPGHTFSTLAIQHPASDGEVERVVSSLRCSYERSSDVALLLNTLGKLWLGGVQINWSRLYTNERRYRIPLPTYLPL